MVTAVGITSGNMIAKVPQEEPVAKLIVADSRKTIVGRSQAGSAACATLEI
jgi:hypothetical protein